MPSLVIDCSTCSEQATPTCDDCVVSFLCGPPDLVGRFPTAGPHDEATVAVVIDVEELRAIRALERGGLAPGLRHRTRRTG